VSKSYFERVIVNELVDIEGVDVKNIRISIMEPRRGVQNDKAQYYQENNNKLQRRWT
jgi:hypothetical protein